MPKWPETVAPTGCERYRIPPSSQPRNSAIADSVLYFGPMGCRTGFYLLVRGESKETVLTVVKDVLAKILSHEGEVFGASRIECGNYLDLDLADAKRECAAYLDILNEKEEWSFCYE